jgi:antirestriction protein ArdC
MNRSADKIVETLLAHLNSGKLIWHNPYIISAQANAVSNKPYRGINQFITALAASSEGYSSPYWATFKQVADLGGKLNGAKGKGVPILFYKDLPQRDDDEKERRFTVRHSFVFNLDLVSGIDAEKFTISEGDAVPNDDADRLAFEYLDRESVSMAHGNPAYSVVSDTVYMLRHDQLTTTDEYYSALFHELAHSTGHKTRLNRFERDAVRYDKKEEYSKEELVAEITAALLCHQCSVQSDASIENSAAYLQGWMRFIKDHQQAFVTAVQHAYKARDCILGM